MKMANDHRVMADVERRRNRRRDSERKRRRVHRVLEYFESTRCIVTRAYPWSTLSTIRNQPRYTGGGSCTCRANGSLAELRAYTRCRIQIEHIDTTHHPPKKTFDLANMFARRFQNPSGTGENSFSTRFKLVPRPIDFVANFGSVK